MTIKILDAVFETTTTTDTGDIVLAGAQQGFRSFTIAGNNAYVAYQINDGNAAGVVTQREIGIAQVVVGNPNKLKRSTGKILYSTNSNQAISFGTGTKNVLGSIPADILAVRDENLNFLEGCGVGGGTANAHTVALATIPLAYSDLMTVKYIATAAPTGNMTINVNQLGDKGARMNGAQVPVGAVVVGSLVTATYSLAAGYFEITSSTSMALSNTALQPVTGQVVRQSIAVDTTVLVVNTAVTPALAANAYPNTAGQAWLTVPVQKSPNGAANKLYARVVVPYGAPGGAGAGAVVMAYLDTGANAIKAGYHNVVANDSNTNLSVWDFEITGITDTLSHDLKIRIGKTGSNNYYLNRCANYATLFGSEAMVIVTEIRA